MAKLATREEYEWAVNRVEQLLRKLDGRAASDNEEKCLSETGSGLRESTEQYGFVGADDDEVELKLLSDLVSEYSEQNYSVGEPSLVDMIGLRLYERGMTQKQLAELLGISPSRIAEYMNGKAEPTLKIAREISRKLDIDPAIVLGV